MPADIEIAQNATMRRISDVARDKLGIADEHLEPFGYYKAKIALGYIDGLADRPDGKLILVTAISPTPAAKIVQACRAISIRRPHARHWSPTSTPAGTVA